MRSVNLLETQTIYFGNRLANGRFVVDKKKRKAYFYLPEKPLALSLTAMDSILSDLRKMGYE